MKGFQKYLAISVCAFIFLSFSGVLDFSIAQDVYPSRAVTLVVGYGAGGQTDVATRIVAPVMEKILGQPVVVVNKPGASAAIMMEFVRHSLPDGYTLGAYASGAIAGTHIRNVPYHFFNDFIQICQITQFDMVLAVHVDSPWKTAKDLVDYGRKNPGKLRWGSSGIGGASHMTSEQFGYLNNFKWECIPFDGDAPAATALMGKHIDVAIQPLPACGPHAQGGRLKLLLVFTKKRLELFPDGPTAEELGLLPHEYKFGVSGFCGPKNLPANVVEKISSTVKAALKDPNVIRLMERQYVHPTFRAGEEWISYLKDCDEEEVKVMKRMGLKIVRDAYKYEK